MRTFLGSETFWFGAVLLMLSQVGKFCEFREPQSAVLPRSNLFLQLKPRDPADSRTFNLGLGGVLCASFLIYLMLCAVPPTLLQGWLTVTGTNAAGTAVPSASDTYPLFVAAAMIGLTQPIPGLDKVANFQKDVFHRVIGIPERVARTAAGFTDQIFARAGDPEALKRELDRFLDDRWIQLLGRFADTASYRNSLERIDLDTQAEMDEVRRGSDREKKFVIQELTLAAGVATVRRGGGRALPRLAEALDVSMPIERARSSDWGGGLLIVFACSVFLWFLIPFGAVRQLLLPILGEAGVKFLPADLYESGQYVLSNFIPPIMVALLVSLGMEKDKPSAAPRTPTLSIVNDHAVTVVYLALAVVAYDYVQAFLDRGHFVNAYNGDTLFFVASRTPFYFLHSLIPAFVAVAVVVYTAREDIRTDRRRSLLFIAAAGAWVALMAFFYAEARWEYQLSSLHLGSGADFRLLVILLNVAAALLSLLIVDVSLRRRSARLAAPPVSAAGRPARRRRRPAAA